MIKKTISWIVLCVSILCIYINMASIMSQDIENIKVDSVSSIQVEEELIIEDEPVPGGAAVAAGGEIAFYIGVVMVIAISIGVISKKSK